MMIYTIVSKYLFKSYSHSRIIFFFTRSQSSNLTPQKAQEYIETLWKSCNFEYPMPTIYYAFEKDDSESVQNAPTWLLDQLNTLSGPKLKIHGMDLSLLASLSNLKGHI